MIGVCKYCGDQAHPGLGDYCSLEHLAASAMGFAPRESDGNPKGEKPQALSAEHDSAGPAGTSPDA